MPDPLTGPAREAFDAGVRRFDAGEFFEAHEAFEDLWRSRDVAPADRPFWKGVTQVAVAFCHVKRGNAPGALALAGRAVANLRSYPSPHRGVDTRALVDAVRAVAEEVEARGCAPPPRLPPFPRAP